jgi:cardiolipin synthase A/B
MMQELLAHLGFSAAVATAAHLVIALAVTVHVLLNKRDVGSSMAWMGLAWLSPFIGSALYFIMGINRVNRRARRIRRPRRRTNPQPPRLSDPPDDPLAPLEYAGWQLTQRPAEDGNTVQLIQNGDNAYPQMVAAIDDARVSVGLSSYIFRADETGSVFIDALIRAQQRGVEVRVLIDGVGGGYLFSPTYRRLRHAGVPAARFLHSILPWRMPFLNLRLHKKFLGIDGRFAFTGGLNIGDENVLKSNPPHPVRDTHFRVEGPVVGQLFDAFAEDWLFTTSEQLGGEAWFPTLKAAGDVVARVVTSGPDQDMGKIEFMILHAVACARQSIRILTPYFLPNDVLISALAVAAMRGIQIDVIVPENSNHPPVDWGRNAQVRPMLVAGCRIHLAPPPFDHSKLMVIDGNWCLIGSANWDVRSFRLNFELDVEMRDGDLARQIDALMDAKQGRLLSIDDIDHAPLAAKLRNNAARLALPYL